MAPRCDTLYVNVHLATMVDGYGELYRRILALKKAK